VAVSWAVWITGLPGSGKSAIARATADLLRSRGEAVIVLELDRIRKALTPSPTYDDIEREAVYRALVYMAAVLTDAGAAVIVDATGHRRAWRELARATIPRFAEVQLHCPLDVCRERERTRGPGQAPAGIYARAVRPGATVPGVNVEYEFARCPELAIDTTKQSIPDAAAEVVALVARRLRAEGGAPPPLRHRQRELRRELLSEDGPEPQRTIARRALAHTAGLLREAGVSPGAGSGSQSGARGRMVDFQIAARGVRDPAVLAAMRRVPREAFVAERLACYAYDDEPLPIGEGQTISQPYIVARMTEALRLASRDRVLEIGTGSGYSAAVLAEIVTEVYTVERLPDLAEAAERRLADLGYLNVHVRQGDGSLGWAEHAPYDAIVVTAGGPEVPRSLLQQLAIGGRLVMPVGPQQRFQRLVRVTRTGPDTYEREMLEEVAFVPLVGAEGWPDG
jgi:protein-L-isoaspartate(D-aspartate) O-methyltransferase